MGPQVLPVFLKFGALLVEKLGCGRRKKFLESSRYEDWHSFPEIVLCGPNFVPKVIIMLFLSAIPECQGSSQSTMHCDMCRKILVFD